MRSEVMTVTPEMAIKWLQNNYNNRKVRTRVVETYARQMKAGKWDLTGNGITISVDGEIIDGQHRLHAIVESGCSVQMLVCFDADKSMNYDNGFKRTIADQIRMSGHGDWTSHEIAIANMALELSTGKRPVASEINEWLYTHKRGIELVSRNIHNANTKAKSKFRKASVGLAFIAALESGIPSAELITWANVCVTGMYSEKYQESAIAFRNLILFDSIEAITSESRRLKVLNLAMASIKHYVAKDGVTRLVMTKELAYKIPE